MSEVKQINYDSAEAAEIKTITGWVSSTGRFFGNGSDSERMARYDGCTHMKCDCGNYMSRGWTKCDSCRFVSNHEKYLQLPFVEYTGQPVCIHDGDQYFFDEDDLISFIEDQLLYTDDESFTLNLLICDPVYLRTIDWECFSDEMHEDWEPSKKLEQAVEALNKVIESEPTQTWYPGKKRTSYTLERKQDAFHNKNIVTRSGGRKHKKNPFMRNYRK